MKFLIAFSLLTLSLTSFAEQSLNDQLGQDKGEYQQCKNDTADCTVGCEKKCAHLDPAQYELDFGGGSTGTKGKQGSTKQ